MSELYKVFKGKLSDTIVTASIIPTVHIVQNLAAVWGKGIGSAWDTGDGIIWQIVVISGRSTGNGYGGIVYACIISVRV